MTAVLSSADVRSMLLAVSQAVINNVDLLTDADIATGDGDHGIGMQRGFEAALEALEADGDLTIQDVFKKTGMAIMSKTGGAAGAVFGTFFLGGAGAFEGAEVLTPANFSVFLEQAKVAVSKRGGVEEGAKTMLDAVAFAERSVSATDAKVIGGVLKAAHEGALAGVEATKHMIASTGKARSLGERSIGHPDPGAISVSIIFGAMSSYASGSELANETI